MLKKIASNTIAQIISKIITAIISIFLLSILTKYLSIEGFGLYSKIFNYLGIFAFLADLGLYTIMIREISNHPQPLLNKEGSRDIWQKHIEKIVGNVLTLRVGLGIIIIFLALIIAYFIPGYNSNIELLSIFIIGIFTLISLMNSTFLAYMQSQLKMEFSLISVVAGKILNLILVFSVVFIFFSKGLKPSVDIFGDNIIILIFLSALVGIILNTLLNYFYSKKSCEIKFRFNLDYIKYIFKISLPYGIALFLSVIYFKIDIILLSIMEGEKANISIALYSLPMKIIEVLMVISGFYLNSILPKLSNLFDENNSELQKLLIISFKILFSFGLIVLTFGTLFRNNIIEIIANKDYINPINHIYSSTDAFLIVLAVLLFNAISLLFIYIFIGAKKQSILLKINIFITIFNIIGNILLIPKYSFIGAGIITLISQILLLIISYYYSRKIIKFNFPKIFIFKIILLSVIMYFIINFLLQNYSINLYLDILVYGVFGAGIFSYLVFREIKK
ncbi:MAG: oligosaccharide flippase family protein [Candidatus Gracilibacteria bacterium]|nr:oligosaccharide flippase family protein [Candidatus Gracilibacteria bacterium]